MSLMKQNTKLIAPSLLSADFKRLGEEIKRVEAAGADWHHFDVMDGHFVPNISMGPMILKAAKEAASKPLDVHLMISEPDQYLESFAMAGADHITIHVEASPNLTATISKIKELGCKAGLVVKPQTEVEKMQAFLPLIDIALVMSVEPGFGGQKFMGKMLSKVRKLRNWIDEDDLQCLIEIDGGIDENNIGLADEAGVNVFVAGTAVYGHPEGATAAISKLRKKIST